MQDQATQEVKNNRGALGPICNYCGGYGFTNILTQTGGGSAGCPKCLGSGVEPPDLMALAHEVQMLTKAVNGLLERERGHE